MNPRSLRFRMTAWYAGLLATTLLIVGASVYVPAVTFVLPLSGSGTVTQGIAPTTITVSGSGPYPALENAAT